MKKKAKQGAAFRVIPVIDLLGGKCVRLSQYNYGVRMIYGENPIEIVAKYEELGIKHVLINDLDSMRLGRVLHWDQVDAICQNSELSIIYRGKVTNDRELMRVLELGVSQVVPLGKFAETPDNFINWLKKYSGDKIALSLNYFEENLVIADRIQGEHFNLENLIYNYIKAGLNTIFCSNITDDDIFIQSTPKIYQKILDISPKITLIANANIESIEELKELQNSGVAGCTLTEALYNERISKDEIRTICYNIGKIIY